MSNKLPQESLNQSSKGTSQAPFKGNWEIWQVVLSLIEVNYYLVPTTLSNLFKNKYTNQLYHFKNKYNDKD